MIRKTVRLFGTNTITTSNTISWANSNLANQGSVWADYDFMDVICNVGTLTGGGGLYVTVQEQFPTNDSGAATYMTTAQTNGTIGSTGQFYMTAKDNNLQTGTPYAAPGTAKNLMLGKGHAKKVIFSTTGTVSAISADVIFVFNNE